MRILQRRHSWKFPLQLRDESRPARKRCLGGEGRVRPSSKPRVQVTQPLLLARANLPGLLRLRNQQATKLLNQATRRLPGSHVSPERRSQIAVAVWPAASSVNCNIQARRGHAPRVQHLSSRMLQHAYTFFLPSAPHEHETRNVSGEKRD